MRTKYFQLLLPLHTEIQTDSLPPFRLGHPEIRDFFTMIHLNIHCPLQHIKGESLYPERQRQCTHIVPACLCHCAIPVLSGSLTLPERRNIRNLSEGDSAQSKCLLQQSFLGTRL